MKKDLILIILVIILLFVMLFLSACSRDKSEIKLAKEREKFWASAETEVVASFEVADWEPIGDNVYVISVYGDIPERGDTIVVDDEVVTIRPAGPGNEKLQIVREYLTLKDGSKQTALDLYPTEDEYDKLASLDYNPSYELIHYILYINEQGSESTPLP